MYHAQHGSPQELRRQFSSDRLETATSEQILVLCFDRLDRDLALARLAIETGDHFATNEALGHAQDLVGELAAMLDLGAWEHAGALLSVYDYLLRLLQTANVQKSDGLVAEAQALITEIGDAFRAIAPRSAAPSELPSARADGGTPASAFESETDTAAQPQQGWSVSA